jgi:ABC-2 type transport system ATP-binding protein
LIEVRQLTKTYTTYRRGHSFREALASLVKRDMVEVEAVKGISFRIGKGEIVGFLGPNGAGKSTTLKMLTGVLHPTSGEAEVMGYVPWKQRKRYVANIGAVFGQKSQLLWDIPPIDAFYLNKEIYDVPESAFRETMDELTELLGVGDIIRKPTRQLSLGERMKCEFMMAMLHRPQVVFLDEPTIGLDVIAKETIRRFIREMNAKGVTFILTTHDLGDVEELARRVIVINHGEIVFDGGIRDLAAHLGDRKRVRVTTEQPADWTGIAGIQVTGRKAEETELELDTAALPLKDFIGLVNERYMIRDMAIEALPIDRVIKELYQRQ